MYEEVGAPLNVTCERMYRLSYSSGNIRPQEELI